MTTMVAPSRSIEQRISALEKANRIRVTRARAKKAIYDDKTRDLLIDLLLLESTPVGDLEDFQTMKVVDLLLAGRWLGQSRVRKVLKRAQVSPSKTLAGLSARQRLAIAWEVKR
jgi:hypothetical protein